MRLKTLLIIYATVGLVYPLGLLLVPSALLSIYGVSPSPASELMARFFGAAITGVTLVAWFARNVADSGVLRGITLAFFVFLIVMGISLLVIPREEAELISKFGTEYRGYSGVLVGLPRV